MRLLTKSLNLQSKIKSGYYDINVDMSVVGLLNRFTSEKVATRSVTLIEGNINKYLKNQ
jgi:cell division protein YceG involved in septum cleavage